MTESSVVGCASATPLNDDLSPDPPAFTTPARWLLSQGCDGLALLGTTGEAHSLSLAERRAILEAALQAGIAADRLLPGTGLPNIPGRWSRRAMPCRWASDRSSCCRPSAASPSATRGLMPPMPG